MMSQKAMKGWLEGCFIKADGSNLVDLTHEWYEGMPQPGFFPPMRQEAFHTHEKDGVLCFYNHLLESCGTHCEAPAHMLKGGPTIDETPLSWLIGPAVVINIREKCEKNPDYKLSVGDLENWEGKYGRIPDNSWLIKNSGWSERWGAGAPDSDEHYPGFEPMAMRWLVENNRHIVGVATECLSPEGGTASRSSGSSKKTGTNVKMGGLHEQRETPQRAEEDYTGRLPLIPVRDELLPVWNTLIIENMANVGKLPEAGAWIIVGVIPFRGGSGGQARIFGVLPVDK